MGGAIEAITAVKSAYADIMDPDEPQKPTFYFKLMDCVDLESINQWNNCEDQAACWTNGLMLKFTDMEFLSCLTPVLPEAMQWDNHDAQNAVMELMDH